MKGVRFLKTSFEFLEAAMPKSMILFIQSTNIYWVSIMGWTLHKNEPPPPKKKSKCPCHHGTYILVRENRQQTNGYVKYIVCQIMLGARDKNKHGKGHRACWDRGGNCRFKCSGKGKFHWAYIWVNIGSRCRRQLMLCLGQTVPGRGEQQEKTPKGGRCLGYTRMFIFPGLFTQVNMVPFLLNPLEFGFYYLPPNYFLI